MEECLIFGFLIDEDIFSVLNYCILQAKYHIYYKKIFYENETNFIQYLCELKYKLKLENIICSNNNSNSFDKFLFLFELL